MVIKQIQTIIILILALPLFSYSQNKGILLFELTDSSSGNHLPYTQVVIEGTNLSGSTDYYGTFVSDSLSFGTYDIIIGGFDYHNLKIKVNLHQRKQLFKIKLTSKNVELHEVKIVNKGKEDLNYKMSKVDHTVVTAGIKTEEISTKNVDGNKSAGTGRLIYKSIAGLNIWESDGAGIQLGIGSRGLDPSRTSSFNTRQNGYDISADALGYPESYYTPNMEAVEKIQLIRGAAALQFGTQFGGLLNFVMKEGGNKKAELIYKQTKGSFGFDNFFSSIGGTVKDVNYYVYGNYKNGNDWRPNSDFDVYSFGTQVKKKIGKNSFIKFEFTKMNYLTQQPGGLTDMQFNTDPSVSKRDRNWFKIDWNLAAISYSKKFKEGSRLSSKLFGLSASRQALGFLGQINRIDLLNERTLISGQYNNWGNETRWLKTYKVDSNMYWTAVAGVRIYQGHSSSRQGEASSDSSANFNFIHDEVDGSSYTFPSSNYSAFAEHIFQVNSKFGITPGIRYEHIRTKADGAYRETIQDIAGTVIFDSLYSDLRNNNRNLVIGGIAFDYQTHEHHRIYANITQNYRSINFTDMQIQNPNYKIDPHLKDETGFNADIGFQGLKKGLLYYDVSFFLLSYDNRIGTTIEVDPQLYNTYQYRTNISASITKGVEAFVEFDAWKAIKNDSSKFSFKIFLNGSIIDARYINSEVTAFENKKVELVPPFSIKSGFKFSYKKFTASYQYSYTQEHFSDATNSVSQGNAVNGIIPSYWISDASVKYSISRLEFGTGVNNLLDQSYFTRRASGYPGPGIIPSSPRNFYLSLQITL